MLELPHLLALAHQTSQPTTPTLLNIPWFQPLLSACCLRPRSDVHAALTCARARLQDGQAILELGCGWGSLTLFMAQAYRNSSITAVSNSNTQREFIMRRARDLGLSNVQVLTADMVDFQVGCV